MEKSSKIKTPTAKDTCEVWIIIEINGRQLKLTKKEALLVLKELEKLNLKSTHVKFEINPYTLKGL